MMRILVDNSDIAFFQEVPFQMFKAARDSDSRGEVPGYLDSHKGLIPYVSNIPDAQAENQGCRCMLVARSGGNLLNDTHMSGGIGFRYPVSVLFREADRNYVFTAAHVTSGNGTAADVRKYLSNPAPAACAPHLDNWVWLIGADFNFSTQHNNVGRFRGIQQPNETTHQSGSVLDGFYCEDDQGNFPPLQVSRFTPDGSASYTSALPGPPPGPKHVYDSQSTLGFFWVHHEAGVWYYYKMSDHAPVLARVA